MDFFTIEGFWIPRLGVAPSPQSDDLVSGWSFEHEGPKIFLEAPLTQSLDEFGDEADPEGSPIILVSAPGAVGKSTLARQIASVTGSVYVDLAESEPVAGYTFSGGLVTSKIYSYWMDGKITALIDGLDEALLKTTTEGFEAFLTDVANVSLNRSMPTVLFGRTGAVQDAWLYLYDKCKGNVAVLEIGYYDVEKSNMLAEELLYGSYPDRQRSAVDREALALLLQGLRRQTESDGDRFAGYAPVLQAVAKHVGEEKNPFSLVTKLKQDEPMTITLHSVVDAVLKREQKKLETLQFHEPEILEKLYTPEEQLDHLISRIFKVPRPTLPEMSTEDAEIYQNALESWVENHPFLDGDTRTPSAVFDAVICAQALKGSTDTSKKAVERELAKGEAANPFLHVFYNDETFESETFPLPGEHIGVIYSSVRAGLTQGDSASLNVEGPEDSDEEDMRCIVEIEISRQSNNNQASLEFETVPDGPICLGPHVRNAAISMPDARVELGQENKVQLVAPVTISCRELAIGGQKVLVDGLPDLAANSVSLQAEKFQGEAITGPIVTRNDVELSVTWPDAENYPWTGYVSKPSTRQDEDPKVNEALRRLRKFIVSFRAKGKKTLARSKRKIDSPRMTKGAGKAVLNSLLAQGVVSLSQEWYFLHPDKLSEMTGTSYLDFENYRYDSKAREFVRSAIGSVED